MMSTSKRICSVSRADILEDIAQSAAQSHQERGIHRRGSDELRRFRRESPT